MYTSNLQTARYNVEDAAGGMTVAGTYSVRGDGSLEEVNINAIGEGGAAKGALIVNSDGYTSVTTMPGGDPAEIGGILLDTLARIREEVTTPLEK
ncbi:Uncharacterised protein [Alistipes sp. cv1]|nr:Uncharacterised protein [Faecalibacterium prausnitzii]